jgi:transposase-like protein
MYGALPRNIPKYSKREKKMTEEELEETIVKLKDEGLTYKEISRRIGVSYTQIARALRNHEKKKLAKDPIALLEEQANLEERRAKALKRLEKAKELQNEPGFLHRLMMFEIFITRKIEEIELRIAKVEDRLKSVNGGGLRSFKDEVQDLAELEKLNLLGLEVRRRTWGW